MLNRFIIFTLLLIIYSCGSRKKGPPESEYLKLLGEMEIPYEWDFDDTVIGGLSGIDYNSETNTFYTVSDDRSVHSPARFYEFNIELDSATHQPINFEFLNVIELKNSKGEAFSNAKINPKNSVDLEDIRYNKESNTFLISAEGERLPAYNFYKSPSLIEFDENGNWIKEIKSPENANSNETEMGIRRNGAFEGLTFVNHYNSVLASMEIAMYQDGAPSSTTQKSLTRIFEFSNENNENTAQYAYELDEVKFAPTPEDAFSVNGITSILNYKENKILVVERSYSDGRGPCSIRIYLADYSNAENIMNVDSLMKQQVIKTMEKTLWIDMDNLGRYVDNIEGMSFGPTLPNGNRTLVLISDNNFSEKQKTQIFVFEILKS